jgi:putative oxidoreductase
MPIAAAVIGGTMVVAIAKVHGPRGFFNQNGGYEYNLVLLVAALTLAATGPGAYSLGRLLGR